MSDSDHRDSSPPMDRAAVGAAKSAARLQLKTGSSNPNMNGPLYMQTSGSNVVLVRRLKRKDDGTWRHLARWFVENQIGLSFNLLALLFLAHGFIPKARTHTRKFFHLAYYNQETEKYGIGFDDAYFLTFCIVLFTGLRAGTMEYVLAPFARLQGVAKRKILTRFSEQAWLLLYYSVFWTLGMYIYCTSPYFLNMREFWTDWPDREINGLTKGYILAQWAFWLQQIIVINIEDRRKDHWQMFSHHIITTALISSCYCYSFTRIGNYILVIMDVVDLFFPVAKCLKYTGYNTLCDVAFGVFMLSWFVARHVFYVLVCWSVYAHAPNIISLGCYSGPNSNLVGPEDAPPGLYYLIEPFLSPTGRLITIIWFTMIVRVAIKVIRGDGAEDTRSDDEGEEEEDEEEEVDDEFVYEEAQPLEEEVGVEALDLKGWERRTGVKRQANSSGVSLPGHSDRKELLGRIGCEKQVE
ncbi:TLC domain-containing protein [Hirsutella rhossiliensis]|uniref:TLC domain-containing protein n=1 Tax=Hirsutella rhossiliensis TaxID=111463 RepID=A0A9P8SDX1_9HYPO|nr:TLC domain-containing protein [Hirsutella rhossiliensis]KAH0958399.1 TLC domain-containing protein [Hirsutella rhossiliensis]